MNENLRKKLTETLREYAESLVNDDRDIITRLTEMNEVQNILKIIDNYDELEDTLIDFFQEKNKKEKWERGN